ncbi:MAG: hypothetical protein WCW33_06365 [Candidatus Babeliales bacterium]|jgi:hypothetical protein
MSFNTKHKRIIGFVVITLMGAGPLSALTETGKRKKPDTVAAVIKLPKAGSNLRAENRVSKQRKQTYKQRAYKGVNKSSRTLSKAKKGGKKVAVTKSKNPAKKKVAGKRVRRSVATKSVDARKKHAQVASRTKRSKTLAPKSVDELRKAH